MKYGLLVNKTNRNLGDDIQSYAEACFLPRVDMMINRETMDRFQYEEGTEPVALIMGAWFMWHKYNWPPARQIIPLNVGYHHYNRAKNVIKSTGYAVPIFEEHYQGIGGQWFRDYGPVGCRDYYTHKIFQKNNIPSYFSGCVTLTLPKQPETDDKGKYVVLVDLESEVEKKVRKIIGNKYEIRAVTHHTKKIENATWEERQARAIDYLTLYQNAKYVVTRRLHVALPCLAMEVPVMVINYVKMNDPNRFDPYDKWLHYCSNDEFLYGNYTDFDFENGTPNKDDYLETRETISKTIKEFVSYCEDNKDKPLEFFDKTSYTEDECLRWRVQFMRNALNKTHTESKQMWQMCKEVQNKPDTFTEKVYKKHVKGTPLAENAIVVRLKRRLKGKKK